MRQVLAAIARLLGSLLPTPPSDADYPATEAEAAARRRRFRRRLLEKQGHGGNR
jgi:hypothetical protein